MSHHEHHQDHERTHTSRERLRQRLDEAAAPEPDHRGQERNAGVAIFVLAALVVLLLLAMVSGATGMFRP